MKMEYKGEQPPPPYPGPPQDSNFGVQAPPPGFNPNLQYVHQQPSQFVNRSLTSTNIVVQTVAHGGVGVMQAAPVDYSSQALIACFCCFWPTGILAIMKAKQCREALAVGDIVGAHAAAESARSMVRISYIIGSISFAAIIFLFIVFTLS